MEELSRRTLESRPGSGQRLLSTNMVSLATKVLQEAYQRSQNAAQMLATEVHKYMNLRQLEWNTILEAFARL